MKNFLLPFGFALLLSLLLHLLFFNTFNKTLKNRDLKINSTEEIKKDKGKGRTSVKYVKLQKPKIIEKPAMLQQQKPKPIKPVLTEPIQKIPKKVVRKKTKPIRKDPKISKNVKTIKIPKAKEEVDLKQLFTMTPIEQLKQKEEESQIDKERYLVKKLDPMTQYYIQLYGDEYYSFSEEQKEYLKQNLSQIGKITQRYLQYPAIAGKTGQSGTNIVEFTLHPNGDITDLRITDSSHYTSLDKNTIETIEIAYKDYPKPTNPTKIKIFVNYVLY